MTQHTFGCGCSVEIEGAEGDIEYCSLHSAAAKMLEALEQIIKDGNYDDDGDFYLLHQSGETDDYLDPEAILMAELAIREARGSQTSGD